MFIENIFGAVLCVFVWTTLLRLVLDYRPDLLFLLFSHLITSLLSSYSPPKWSHLFPGLEYPLDADDFLSYTSYLDLSLVLDLHFQLPPSCYLYLLASQWSKSSRISKIDLSVFVLNFLIGIPHSWPLPPLSSSLPCHIVITVHSLFRPDTWKSSLILPDSSPHIQPISVASWPSLQSSTIPPFPLPS